MTKIQINLNSTKGNKLFTLSISIQNFKEAGAFKDTKQMFQHLSGLLYSSARFTEESQKVLLPQLEELRESRRTVYANAIIELQESKLTTVSQDTSSMSNLKRMRNEIDQANAENSQLKKTVQENSIKIDVLENANEKLATQITELIKLNDSLKQQLAVQKAKAQKLNEAAEKNKELREKIVQLEKLTVDLRAKVVDSDRGKDPFG